MSDEDAQQMCAAVPRELHLHLFVTSSFLASILTHATFQETEKQCA